MAIAQITTLSNTELTRIFFAIVLLLITAHGLGYIFRHFKLPKVIGEILAGLLFGPTILGYFFPQASQWIFHAFEAEGKVLSLIYWIGLVMLMFIAGFETQHTFNKEDKKIITYILIGSTVIPFIAGWFIPSLFDFTTYLGPAQNPLAFKIIIAIAIAVTSIPVISKIFLDLNIIHTRFAKLIISIATIEDVLLWIVLAIATGIVTNQNPSYSSILTTIIITIAFFLIGLKVIPKLLHKTNSSKYNLLLRSSISGYLLFICFFFAALASILNVNIVFGALLAGIIISTLPAEKFDPVKNYIKDISQGFFIPIYFALVGIKLDLIHHFNPLFFLGFLLFATLCKILGTLIAAKLLKKDNLTSLNFAIAMNTRGGPGIVVATIAFDLGIINETFFVTLILIAIVTSLFAGYWFKKIITANKPLMTEN